MNKKQIIAKLEKDFILNNDSEFIIRKAIEWSSKAIFEELEEKMGWMRYV